MLVAVVSAGNQGRSDWQFVTSPGDVEDAITVGSARGAQPERRPTSGIGNPDMAFIKPRPGGEIGGRGVVGGYRNSDRAGGVSARAISRGRTCPDC
ncbi:MAG: S08 family peptidase [Oceanicaulis sp. HLUCCA04]|nr:MAG: S08 family peptidase [Oceanicaulis sp. HLUCCA04]